MVGHDVGMPAGFQHEDFLLEGGDIVVCKEGQERKGSCRQGATGDWLLMSHRVEVGC